MSRRSSVVAIALLSLLCLIAAGVPASGETVYYKWVDKDGVTHYTNVQAETPKEGNVERIEPTAPQFVTPEQEQPQPPKKSPAPAAPEEQQLEPLPPQPRPAPTPAQSRRIRLSNELNTARAAELAFQTKDLKWLTPDEISQYLSKEDLQRMPRYGFDQGAPRIRRVEAIFFMRNKIKELEAALR